MKKEYVVSLNRDVDYDKFWNEMETNTEGLFFIPDRQVEIINNRDGSLRSCHYLLTDEEVEILKRDSRIYSVEIPPDQRTDIKIGLTGLVTGNFVKPSNSGGTNINWGLVRCSNPTNVYGENLYPSANVYYYEYDATGVDVVIQDSGIEWSHPEFKDSLGNSRVQLIDWYTASGISGTQSANHYRDLDGHGTHVAGITVGKNYGWAKNANIYSVKVNGLEGSGDSGTGISISDCFDVIKLWHRNKPVDPVTGVKRPTIVNASWGYTTTVTNTNISAINYRGNSYSGASITGYINKWNLGVAPYGTIVSGPDIGV
jgi:subtilisin family serine protease